MAKFFNCLTAQFADVLDGEEVVAYRHDPATWLDWNGATDPEKAAALAAIEATATPVPEASAAPEPEAPLASSPASAGGLGSNQTEGDGAGHTCSEGG